MVDLVLLGGGGEHERVAAILQLDHQLARALQRAHLLDQLHVEVALERAHLVTVRALELVARERADQLVPAHPDVTVDAVERQRQADLAEGAEPCEGMLVVRVHQRAVDVQDRRGRARHAALPARWR